MWRSECRWCRLGSPAASAAALKAAVRSLGRTAQPPSVANIGVESPCATPLSARRSRCDSMCRESRSPAVQGTGTQRLDVPLFGSFSTTPPRVSTSTRATLTWPNARL